MLKYDCKNIFEENVIIMKMRYINQVTIVLKKVFQDWNYDKKLIHLNYTQAWWNCINKIQDFVGYFC